MAGERARARGVLKQQCSQHLLLLLVTFPSFYPRAIFHSTAKWFTNILPVATVWDPLTVGTGHADRGRHHSIVFTL